METFQSLNRLRFPEVVESALQKLSHFLNQEGANVSIPGLGGGVEDLTDAIVKNYIFPTDAKSMRRTAMEELRLLQMLMESIQGQQHYREQLRLFRALFAGRMDPRKRSILCQLLSMGICVKSKPILLCVASWIKQQGPISAESIMVAESVISDYCSNALSQNEAFLILPKVDRLFACNLMAAVCAAYKPDKPQNIKQMPDVIVKTIAGWLDEDPTLCLECLKSKDKSKKSHSSAGLFSGSDSSRLVVSPVPGLVTQCVAASVNTCLSNRSGKGATDGTTKSATVQVYSKLLLAVLQGLMAFKRDYHDRYVELITFKDMTDIKQLLLTTIKMTDKEQASEACTVYSQTLQVALATGALRIGPEEVQQLTSGLSQSRLLEIIQHRSAHSEMV